MHIISKLFNKNFKKSMGGENHYTSLENIHTVQQVISKKVQKLEIFVL